MVYYFRGLTLQKYNFFRLYPLYFKVNFKKLVFFMNAPLILLGIKKGDKEFTFSFSFAIIISKISSISFPFLFLSYTLSAAYNRKRKAFRRSPCLLCQSCPLCNHIPILAFVDISSLTFSSPS